MTSSEPAPAVATVRKVDLAIPRCRQSEGFTRSSRQKRAVSRAETALAEFFPKVLAALLAFSQGREMCFSITGPRAVNAVLRAPPLADAREYSTAEPANKGDTPNEGRVLTGLTTSFTRAARLCSEIYPAADYARRLDSFLFPHPISTSSRAGVRWRRPLCFYGYWLAAFDAVGGRPILPIDHARPSFVVSITAWTA